jgi:hypothetical protein
VAATVIDKLKSFREQVKTNGLFDCSVATESDSDSETFDRFDTDEEQSSEMFDVDD